MVVEFSVHVGRLPGCSHVALRVVHAVDEEAQPGAGVHGAADVRGLGPHLGRGETYFLKGRSIMAVIRNL